MNYTKNYHLPQWIKEDRIMMEDFNAMNSSIESGLTTANTNASAANSKADAAVQTANAAAAAKPYVVGSYVGTEAQIKVTLGFCPSFLLIFSDQKGPDTNATAGRFIAASSLITSGSKVTILNDGFLVAAEDYSQNFPMINAKGMQCQYVAFR